MLIAIRPLLAELGRAAPVRRRAGSRWAGARGRLRRRRRSTRASWSCATRRSGPPGHGAELQRLPADPPRQAGPLRGPGPLRRLRAARRRHPRAAGRVPRRRRLARTRRSPSTPATPTARSTSTPSPAATLDGFPYVITGRAAWNSQAPPSFRRIAATPSYVLWERTGDAARGPPRPARGDRAGGDRRLRRAGDPRSSLANPGRASLFPDAVIGPKARWSREQRRSAPARATSQTLDLPAGTLAALAPVLLALRPDPVARPASAQPLTAALDGQRPNTISLANNGQFWPAGEIDSDGGPVAFTLAAADAERPPEPHRLRRQGLRRRAGRGPRRAAPDRAARRRPATAGSTGTNRRHRPDGRLGRALRRPSAASALAAGRGRRPRPGPASRARR